MSAFQKALEYVLANEGGYSNHENDRGGATQYGIIQSEYSRWLKRPATIQDMKSITKAIAGKIYYEWYWKPLKCDEIYGEAKAICIFDMGVNRGIGWPPKKIQAICNVEQDGVIGPLTLRALNSLSDEYFVEEFSKIAEKSYEAIVRHNPSQRVFLKGWKRRARRMLTTLKVNAAYLKDKITQKKNRGNA